MRIKQENLSRKVLIYIDADTHIETNDVDLAVGIAKLLKEKTEKNAEDKLNELLKIKENKENSSTLEDLFIDFLKDLNKNATKKRTKKSKNG